MTNVYYWIMTLWPDEDELYQSEDSEFYFPPSVTLYIEEMQEDGKSRTSWLDQNFLSVEEYEPVQFWC